MTLQKAADCDMVLVHDDDLQKIFRMEGNSVTTETVSGYLITRSIIYHVGSHWTSSNQT